MASTSRLIRATSTGRLWRATGSPSRTSRQLRVGTSSTRSSGRTGTAPRRPGSIGAPIIFFTLCTAGRDQANHFVSVAPPDPRALPPALDIELAGNCDARPDRAAIARQLEDFVSVVEAA